MQEPGKPAVMRLSDQIGDHLHPNDAGYTRMAEAALPVVLAQGCGQAVASNRSRPEPIDSAAPPRWSVAPEMPRARATGAPTPSRFSSGAGRRTGAAAPDRKKTRLNSRHSSANGTLPQ